MRSVIVAFAAGVWLVQRSPDLPDAPLLALLGAAGLVFAALPVILVRLPRLAAAPSRVIAAFLAGILWAALLAGARLADGLPEQSEGVDIRIVGVVASLPQRFDRGLRFAFEVEDAALPVPRRIWLAWYLGLPDGAGAGAVRPGERWQLTVRLKRPHGNVNPHGFDYEGWLIERGLRATGYVRQDDANRRLQSFVRRPGLAVERLRESVRDRFERSLPGSPYAGVLVALAVGDQHSIPEALWSVFNRTGTTHLMSISGLHVTMVGGLAFALTSFAWRRNARLVTRLPARKAGVVGGGIAAFAYALLAGFGVPAQRTLYMLLVVALAWLSDRQVGASRVLALALAVVLLLDPWAVASAGFWLSFGCVAVLLFIGAGRLAPAHWLIEWVRAQWAVTLALIPALLALFQQFSLVSPVANALAIPAVSLIVAPLALIAAVLPFDALLWLDHWLLSGLIRALVWLSELPIAIWRQAAPPAWAIGAGIAGGALLLLPRGLIGRVPGVILMAPLFLVSPQRPNEGEAWITVLDVGQGLSAHVQTRDHDLLYDAGPSYSRDANSGSRIVLPYLRAIGVDRLAGVVVTHQDNDHAGGAEAVMDELPVQWLLSSLPATDRLLAGPARDLRCVAGQRWRWNRVDFEVLHPTERDYAGGVRRDNDLSCVVRISASGRTMLLTSDIEWPAEYDILERVGPAIASDAMLVPHHGSRTSSSPRFVRAVQPAVAIVPVGYRSRFRHPDAEVMQRYRDGEVRLLRTDRDGAIRLRLRAQGVSVDTARESNRRYWHGR